jgi:hypothetical protein
MIVQNGRLASRPYQSLYETRLRTTGMPFVMIGATILKLRFADATLIIHRHRVFPILILYPAFLIYAPQMIAVGGTFRGARLSASAFIATARREMGEVVTV